MEFGLRSLENAGLFARTLATNVQLKKVPRVIATVGKTLEADRKKL